MSHYQEDTARPLLRDESHNLETSLEADSLNGSEQLRKETFQFYFEQLTLLFYPLIITFTLVIWIETTLAINNDYIDHPLVYYDEEVTDNVGIRLGGSIVNALLIVFGIALMTFLFVLMFHYRLYKFLFFWLGLSVFSILSITLSALWIQMMEVYRIPLDFITFTFCTWNFTIVGVVSVFWFSPLWLQQAYLILISAATSISMLRMPTWTTWSVLIAVALYDLFAVLCEMGPLKLLINIAEERQENIPAFVYSSGMARSDDLNNPIGGYNTQESGQKTLWSWIVGSHKNDYETVDTEDISIISNEQNIGAPPSSNPRLSETVEIEEEEEAKEMNAIKLGLGDFIFYSVLVGRASVTDSITLCLCITAILTGLSITILLLAMNRTALPALPISILFGTITYAIAYYMTNSMISSLSINIVLL